jgi:TIGR03009 family protein
MPFAGGTRMPRASLFLVGLFATTSLLMGQSAGTPAPDPFDPSKFPEDWLVAKWEETMSKVDSLVADCEITSIDKVFNTKDVYSGKAKYLRTKAATMGSLELFKIVKGVQDKNQFKKFIYTGNFLYSFVPENKVVLVQQLPKPAPGQGVDNNLLSFVFGMRAADAKKRYELKWQKPDENYYYLEVVPKLAKDKQDFKQARLVFVKSSFMLRQVWFIEPNQNAVVWEFPKISINEPLKVTDFGQPALPPGWRLEKVASNNTGK